ncbi:uncharacterized protein LOC141906060 [Tubulanus polymorphus]|uniref:uncharacterized protein LOC141906060 n=1 Tax=Tubulanus polymorphus TaxID=672921 RepID=UPI003DA5D6B8
MTSHYLLFAAVVLSVICLSTPVQQGATLAEQKTTATQQQKARPGEQYPKPNDQLVLDLEGISHDDGNNDDPKRTMVIPKEGKQGQYYVFHDYDKDLTVYRDAPNKVCYISRLPKLKNKPQANKRRVDTRHLLLTMTVKNTINPLTRVGEKIATICAGYRGFHVKDTKREHHLAAENETKDRCRRFARRRNRWWCKDCCIITVHRLASFSSPVTPPTTTTTAGSRQNKKQQTGNSRKKLKDGGSRRRGERRRGRKDKKRNQRRRD